MKQRRSEALAALGAGYRVVWAGWVVVTIVALWYSMWLGPALILIGWVIEKRFQIMYSFVYTRFPADDSEIDL